MNVSHHPQRRRAIMMLVLATLYWGISFPVIKALQELNHNLLPGGSAAFLDAQTVAPRFALGFLLVLLFNWRQGMPRRAEFIQGFQIGAFAAVGSLLQSDGLRFTSASSSAFLTQMSAVLIPAFLAIRHRRSPRLAVWLACALVLAGAGILGHVSWQQLRLGRGEWETLWASAFYAGQILSLENPRYISNRAGMVTLSMFGVEAVLFLGMAGATAPGAGALLLPWTS
ncbi:MAG TPA: EamA family transporter, partial [Opitutaceae bacterium]|nr:EamA family transporter [Opitutaceae bacterium]